MEHEAAKQLLAEICYKLQPHCEVIEFAGQVKAKAPEVDKLEIVCIPKKVPGHLNGNTRPQCRPVVTFYFIQEVTGLGVRISGNPYGKQIHIGLTKPVIDLFINIVDTPEEVEILLNQPNNVPNS